ISLFKGVEEHKEILDNEISKYLKGWAISRISKVALVTLRIAMYEIMFCDNVDTDIAISEAVLITQTFALKEDVSSVNKDLKKEQ
ncbi:MAG: transcription antitermination factor NusB, partial [Oscillospiraceae bacterium]